MPACSSRCIGIQGPAQPFPRISACPHNRTVCLHRSRCQTVPARPDDSHSQVGSNSYRTRAPEEAVLKRELLQAQSSWAALQSASFGRRSPATSSHSQQRASRRSVSLVAAAAVAGTARRRRGSGRPFPPFRLSRLLVVPTFQGILHSVVVVVVVL